MRTTTNGIRLRARETLVVLAAIVALCTPSPVRADSRAGATPIAPRVYDHDDGPRLAAADWTLTGPHLVRGHGSCFKGLPERGFVLGVDEATCKAGLAESRATTRLVPNGERRVAAVHISCVGACADAVAAAGSSGAVRDEPEDGVSLEYGGKRLWSARCGSDGRCDRLALGDQPVVTVRVDAPGGGDLELRAAPGVRWPINAVKVEWLPPAREIQGIAYSPFRDCQNPDPNRGTGPSREQIIEDLDQLKHSTNAIRTYSSTGIQGEIPQLAHERGLRVSAGAWIGDDTEADEREITALIDVAKRVPLESVIVGNEVLSSIVRRGLDTRGAEDRLIAYIERVKKAVRVQVTTAEIGDELPKHPRLMNELDYYLVHYYPFWEKQLVENAAQAVLDRVDKFRKSRGDDKQVVIGETGWPSSGWNDHGGVASPWNQRHYWREFLALAHASHVEFFYFGAFDELWKAEGEEGSAGQFWGIWDAGRRNKYDLTTVLPVMHETVNDSLFRANDGSLFSPPREFPPALAVYTNYGAQHLPFIPEWLIDPREPGEQGKIEYVDCAEAYGDRPRHDRPPPYDRWNKRVIRIAYNPTSDDRRGWGGIRWVDARPAPSCSEPTPPPTKPSDAPSADYRPQRLRFKAWSDRDDAAVKFFVGGGCEGTPPRWSERSRVVAEADATGFVRLTTEPREYSIDVRGVELSRTANKFGVVMARSRAPSGVRVLLDDVVYDDVAPPTARDVEPDREVERAGERLVYGRRTFGDGFGMGVESSTHERSWVSYTPRDGGYVELRYPSGPSWGAVFVTVGGDPAPRAERRGKTVEPQPERCGMDLSMYRTLSVELNGKDGGEVVWLGLKGVRDPDDGSEIKRRVTLKAGWQTCRVPLSLFAGVDLRRVYVPIEFVFESGVKAETIGFRNVRYLSESVDVVTCQ